MTNLVRRSRPLPALLVTTFVLVAVSLSPARPSRAAGGGEIQVPRLSWDPDAPEEWACLGCHEPQIDAEAWSASLHHARSVSCRHCHPEAAAVPHPDEVTSQHCGDCHDGMDGVLTGAETSAHGPHGPGAANGCSGCHDPHTLGPEGLDSAAFAATGCLECHDADDDLADRHSSFLCQAELHLAKVGCLQCHLEGDDPASVHNVRFGEAARLTCTDCHGSDTVLDASETAADDDRGILAVQNRKLIRETGYLIGANRIVGLDVAMILLVFFAACFPVVHGGLRILFWKKSS